MRGMGRNLGGDLPGTPRAIHSGMMNLAAVMRDCITCTAPTANGPSYHAGPTCDACNRAMARQVAANPVRNGVVSGVIVPSYARTLRQSAAYCPAAWDGESDHATPARCIAPTLDLR